MRLRAQLGEVEVSEVGEFDFRRGHSMAPQSVLVSMRRPWLRPVLVRLPVSTDALQPIAAPATMRAVFALPPLQGGRLAQTDALEPLPDPTLLPPPPPHACALF